MNSFSIMPNNTSKKLTSSMNKHQVETRKWVKSPVQVLSKMRTTAVVAKLFFEIMRLEIVIKIVVKLCRVFLDGGSDGNIIFARLGEQPIFPFKCHMNPPCVI